MKDFHYSTVCSLWDSQNRKIKGAMPHYVLTSKNNGPVSLCTAINPLSPKSDQRQISPCNINAL